jgi:uncharacterized protein YyaL (SSP411 family)
MQPRNFILPVLLACLPGLAQDAPEDRIYWLKDYREALREARQTQKPIFLEFRCEA